jgi:hypothetical protein
MKYKITYCEIQSDHVFAVPTPYNSEVVDADTWEDLDKYILSKKDGYGHKYRKADKKRRTAFGFDYTSNAGAVKVTKYNNIKVKKI